MEIIFVILGCFLTLLLAVCTIVTAYHDCKLCARRLREEALTHMIVDYLTERKNEK